MKNFHHIFYFWTVFSVLSCGQKQNSSNLEPKIFGGKIVSGLEQSSTVGLVVDGYIFCSGVAVDANTVYTAAHCAEDPNLFDSELYIYVGKGSEGGNVKAPYSVDKIHIKDNDFAILTLESTPLNLPKNDYPQVLTDKTLLEAIVTPGQMTTLVGFGYSDYYTSTGRLIQKLGLKHEVQAPIVELKENEVIIGGNGKDTCDGDSGGPVFIKEPKTQVNYVFAVTSKALDENRKCGEGGIYSLIYPNL